MHRLTLALVLLLPAAAVAQTSGPQFTQPMPNQNQSQVETTQSQQHPAASGGGALGQQMTRPMPDQNQPQLRTNQSQQPPNSR